MTDIYAEFGVTNAVISDSSLSEHDLEMAQQPVAVRDGDTAIHISLEEEAASMTEGEHTVNVVSNTEEEEQQVDSISIDTETGELTSNTDEEGVDAGEESILDEATPEEMAQRATTLEESGVAIEEARKGQESIINKAIENGLPSEMVEVITKEFNDNGTLTDSSYEALAAAGYDKSFVDAYIKGQQAIADSYVKNILNYAGGQEVFDKVAEFMGANQPAMADAFNSALDRNDVVTLKALIDSSKQMMKGVYGSKPKVNLTAANVATKASTPASAPKEEGFKNKKEMVDAMSDPRYLRDAAYTHAVEQKVFLSNF